MKQTMLIIAMMFTAACSMAKDIKTAVFTTSPQMHCESCENKIKGNLRFEKGVKNIETNIEKQQVVVTYDADKTSVEKLQRGFEKIGYDAKEVKAECKQETASDACCEKRD
ncbi:MAG: cation transporter [Prevotella sp.]|nr:cation transporter [Prevotella sp.]